MSVPALTNHARKRIQQRAIPPIIVEMLERFGARERCGQAECLYFDKAARKRLCEYFGGARSMKLLEAWLDTSAVIGDDGAVVTVEHRYKRILRSPTARAPR